MFQRISLLISFYLLFSYAQEEDKPCNKVKRKNGYICICNEDYCDTIKRPKVLPQGQFHVYYTSSENPGFNHQYGNFRIQSFPHKGTVFGIRDDITYQTIRGFGGSITDSFGYSFNKVSEKVQDQIMRSFFSEEGMEYTLCRVVIGDSDFSLNAYNYAPDYDPELKTFNLTQADYDYKISKIKMALNITSRKIAFFGSTFTGPDWLKKNNDKNLGYLVPEFRQVWANYIIKALKAYSDEGIEFFAVTTGNEPMMFIILHANFGAIAMYPEEKRDWIAYNLGPALEKANMSNVKIIGLDDQRLYAEWYTNVLSIH